MRTAIIAAMEEEVKYLRTYINNYEVYEFQGYTYYIGDIADQKIVLVQSGIGKVNAALSTMLLLEHFSVSEVINTGSAGGVGTDHNIGDIIVASEAVYNDVDATAFGYAYGQVPQMPESFPSDKAVVRAFTRTMEKFKFAYSVGMIATGDQFVTDFSQIQRIIEHYPDIKAVDMEATAIVQVCYQYMIPVIIVRSISDVINKHQNNSSADFEKYIDTAAQNSTAVIVEFLKEKATATARRNIKGDKGIEI